MMCRTRLGLIPIFAVDGMPEEIQYLILVLSGCNSMLHWMALIVLERLIGFERR